LKCNLVPLHAGDQYYWYRKQIALELLKHDVASVILMVGLSLPPGCQLGYMDRTLVTWTVPAVINILAVN
jgi:hypothetical protein